MSRIFISYRHVTPDTDVARALVEHLADAGHDVFIDSKIAVGMDWSAEIATHIDWCEFFVVLISKDVLNSEMVQTEIRLAYQRYKREGMPRLLPVRICYFGPLDYELDSYLSRIQYTKWESLADSARLIAELRVAIERPHVAQVMEAERSEPDLAQVIAADQAEDYRRPAPVVDQRVFNAPGGNIRLDDPFYITRTCDTI